MFTNALPSERVAVLDAIDPDALTAATHNGGWVDASKFGSLMAVVMRGTLGAGATFDAKLEQATDASGTGAKDITGKAMTQVTDGSPSVDDDKQAIINLRSDELDMDNDFRYVRLSITVGTATSDGGGLLLGFDPKFAPASDHDNASVDEIVS